MRVAAIDCGTNSIRLLIADVSGGRLTDVARRLELVRLGEGVDRTGRLAPEAIERTRLALLGYAAEIAELGIGRVRMVATSASRDASNAGDFRGMVRSVLGVAPEVISGDEEARLSFTGAVNGLTATGPYLMVDIGGGSTEFVTGTSSVDAAISMDIGCVRMTERHLRDDPPAHAQVVLARADVEAALDEVERTVDLRGVRTVIGLAGSVTTVGAEALGLSAYEPDRIHGSVHRIDDLLTSAETLLHADRADRGARGFMHPGRVDVIGAGALVWQGVLRRVALRAGVDTARVSEHDILDGIAWSLAER
jgi:exopolyphosphatase/guanosine-5'-triphosphate,3'-diphosphate pyrophosphatase